MSKDLNDIRHVIQQMLDIKDTQKQLEERYNALKAVVVDTLADQVEGTLDGETIVTNKTITQYRVSAKWLEDNMPDVYQASRQPVQSSSFRLVMETRDV